MYIEMGSLAPRLKYRANGGWGGGGGAARGGAMVALVVINAHVDWSWNLLVRS
jgi:hypothetical protein